MVYTPNITVYPQQGLEQYHVIKHIPPSGIDDKELPDSKFRFCSKLSSSVADKKVIKNVLVFGFVFVFVWFGLALELWIRNDRCTNTCK